MNEKIFLKNYLLELQKLFIGDDETINNLISLKKIIVDNSKKGKKILINTFNNEFFYNIKRMNNINLK